MPESHLEGKLQQQGYMIHQSLPNCPAPAVHKDTHDRHQGCCGTNAKNNVTLVSTEQVRMCVRPFASVSDGTADALYMASIQCQKQAKGHDGLHRAGSMYVRQGRV